jgi:Barstar (barnase inhibitor)
MKSVEDWYQQFFNATQGLVPDIGGRENWNLDGLHDDLRDLSEPLTVVIDNSEVASRRLGEWFWSFVATLSEKGDRKEAVEVILTATAELSRHRIDPSSPSRERE